MSGNSQPVLNDFLHSHEDSFFTMHTVGEKELKITSNTYVDQLRNVVNKVQEESPLLSLETL